MNLKKRETDVIFRLIKDLKCWIYYVLNSKSKNSSTLDMLGVDIDTLRNWIEYQFTTEMNRSNIETDHVKPYCSLDISKDEELRETCSWKNTQPLLKEIHQQKGAKYNFLDNQLQFIKAYQFIQLNEKGSNEDIHCWNIFFSTWKELWNRKR